MSKAKNQEIKTSTSGTRKLRDASRPKASISLVGSDGSFTVPKERLDRLSEIGFSKSEIHEIVAPPRTLNRRVTVLSLEESDRVLRLERVSEHAVRVFGTLKKANSWLRSSNRALNNAKPIELLISETGAHKIELQLHAIDYGIYA